VKPVKALTTFIFIFFGFSLELWATPDFVDWSSERGKKRLDRSEHRSDFFRIANAFQIETDANLAGLRAASILALALRANQENIFDRLVQRLSGVERPLLSPLRQIREALYQESIDSRLYLISESDSPERIRRVLVDTLHASDEMLLVHFTSLNREGQWVEVFAPLGAYEEESDSFLVMDLHPQRAPWQWVKNSTLFQLMKPSAEGKEFGFIIFQAKSSEPPTPE
jgi:hypothetical protein